MNRLLLTLLTALLMCASAAAQGQTGGAARQPQSGAAVTGSSQASKTPNPKEEDCGCEGAPLPDVLAIVNGVKITGRDVGEAVQKGVRDLQQQVIEARRRELDLQINSKLLEAEAKKLGVSITKLLEAEIVAKAKEPTDAEAQAFYEQNKDRIKNEFKDVKGVIINYLRGQRQNEEAKRLADRLRGAADVKVMVEQVTPPLTPADRARLLATVNGERITSGDIEDGLRPLVYEVQEKVYELRKKGVDLKINDLLLEREAQRRKVTTRALLETEVVAKVPKVTESAAQAFYEQNKERINGDYVQVKEQLIQYLQESEANKMETAFAEELRRGAKIETFLPIPEPPVFSISTDDQPAKGDPAASVTVVEFTDFECPSCASAQPIVERLIKEYGDRVKIVVRDFPLRQHPNAFKAAEAAEAAREQGKYWEYIALLFGNQAALGVERLKEYASQLGLDRKRFDAALDSGQFADKVQRDISEGTKLGISGTPTFFVNGQQVREISYEALVARVEAALKAGVKK